MLHTACHFGASVDTYESLHVSDRVQWNSASAGRLQVLTSVSPRYWSVRSVVTTAERCLTARAWMHA